MWRTIMIRWWLGKLFSGTPELDRDLYRIMLGDAERIFFCPSRMSNGGCFGFVNVKTKKKKFHSRRFFVFVPSRSTVIFSESLFLHNLYTYSERNDDVVFLSRTSHDNSNLWCKLSKCDDPDIEYVMYK